MLDPLQLLKPRREIEGISAILLPLESSGQIDWRAFEAHVERTVKAGLTPAVNMDTGYVHLLDDATIESVLERTRQVVAGRPFVAGAFVGDEPESAFDRDAYTRRIEAINRHGGTPVIFQSYGLTRQTDDDLIGSYQALAGEADRFIGFELGEMFAPFGKIYSLETYRRLMQIRQCIGAKHSSLDRQLEWQRLQLRGSERPDFRVYTGNDLAIDMVMYGSDYLLGLSTFAPDQFARRDRMWADGDPAFYQLNDVLQYLGFFAFRQPVPAYKHSAAMFLHLRGWAPSSETFAGSPRRPDSDREVLEAILKQLSA